MASLNIFISFLQFSLNLPGSLFSYFRRGKKSTLHWVLYKRECFWTKFHCSEDHYLGWW